MFWGLIMEPNKRYTQTVEKSFHVSMASLDVPTADDEMVQVMLCYDNRNYLLCSLKKGSLWQVPLDLNFQEGTKIAFTSNGRGHVHLTGYLIPEDDDLDLDELEEEEDEDEVPQLVGKQSKRKALDAKNEISKKVKRLKEEVEEVEESSDDAVDVDSEDNDDDSEDVDEEEEDGEEEEEDEDEEDDEESEQEEVKETKPEKKKKQQQQPQQQQSQSKKQEKQKVLNGKDVKLEQKQQKKNKGEQQQNAQQEQKKRVVEGGVQVEDLKVGSGAPVKQGKFVTVYYVGRLKNGKTFDSTTQGNGFKFRLGKGEVIKGWDIGISGMKVGGKRRITVPPPMAYGVKGSPPVIPGNSTLIFEVELKNVH